MVIKPFSAALCSAVWLFLSILSTSIPLWINISATFFLPDKIGTQNDWVDWTISAKKNMNDFIWWGKQNSCRNQVFYEWNSNEVSSIVVWLLKFLCKLFCSICGKKITIISTLNHLLFHSPYVYIECDWVAIHFFRLLNKLSVTLWTMC